LTEATSNFGVAAAAAWVKLCCVCARIAATFIMPATIARVMVARTHGLRKEQVGQTIAFRGLSCLARDRRHKPIVCPTFSISFPTGM
jgi:hypothetical protein